MYSGQPRKQDGDERAWLSFALMNHVLVRNHQISLKTESLRYADELVWKNGLEIVYFVKFLHSLHI